MGLIHAGNCHRLMSFALLPIHTAQVYVVARCVVCVIHCFNILWFDPESTATATLHKYNVGDPKPPVKLHANLNTLPQKLEQYNRNGSRKTNFYWYFLHSIRKRREKEGKCGKRTKNSTRLRPVESYACNNWAVWLLILFLYSPSWKDFTLLNRVCSLSHRHFQLENHIIMCCIT